MSSPKFAAILVLMSAIVAASAQAQNVNFTFNGFGPGDACSVAGSCPIVLNASATLVQQTSSGDSNVLQLNPSTTGQRGSAWYATPVPVSGGFSTTFQYRIVPGSRADGIAFVIQNSSSTPSVATTAIGEAGGFIGYSGSPTDNLGIPNSFAVELDTFDNGAGWDPGNNHVAFQSCGLDQSGNGLPNIPNHYADGTNSSLNACNHGLMSLNPQTLDLAGLHTAKIDYDSAAHTLALRIDGTLVLSSQIDLSQYVNTGSTGTAYVGLTGATGALTEENDILSWSFSSSAQLNPAGGTNLYSFGTYNYKVTYPANGGGTVTVTPIVITPAAFSQQIAGDPNFSTAQCIPYANTTPNNQCRIFQVTCTGSDSTCLNLTYDVFTSYDVDPTTIINNPGFLKQPGCTGPYTNIFTSFTQTRTDPTTGGRTTGFSCFVAVNFPFEVTGSCGGDVGHQVLQPVNADGSSVFKQGSTVPVKFRVCTQNSSAPIGPTTTNPTVVQGFQLVGKYSDTAPLTVNETVVSTTPDSQFRWDSTGQQWIFNLSTKNLSSGYTYVYQIKLIDGSSIQFQFKVK